MCDMINLAAVSESLVFDPWTFLWPLMFLWAYVGRLGAAAADQWFEMEAAAIYPGRIVAGEASISWHLLTNGKYSDFRISEPDCLAWTEFWLMLSGAMVLCLTHAGLLGWGDVLLFAFLLPAAAIDQRICIIPDSLSLGPLWMLLGAAAAGSAFSQPLAAGHLALDETVLCAILGYTAIWSLNAAHVAAKGSDAIGMGDAKLLALVLAWYGTSPWLTVLMVGAASTWAAMKIRRLGQDDYAALGPGLILGVLTWRVGSAGGFDGDILGFLSRMIIHRLNPADFMPAIY
jgi:hypothetical protein